MTSHRTEFERRCEQLEDVLTLIKSSGLRFRINDSPTYYALELIEGDYDNYVIAAYIEKEDR